MRRSISTIAELPQDSDFLFWEGLLEVIKAIETFSLKAKKDYLWELKEREVKEGKSWRRQIIKMLLLEPEKRSKVKEAIISGKIYGLDLSFLTI